MKPGRQCNHSEKGQSMVEFAVGLVLLIILMAGIVDLGRALFTYMSLRDAAQEAANYAIINPSDTNGIKNRARESSNMMKSISSDGQASTAVDVTINGGACTGNEVVIKVTYSNFPITMPFLGALIGSQNIPLVATISDTILSPGCK